MDVEFTDIDKPVRPLVPVAAADRATGLLRSGNGGLGAAICPAPADCEAVEVGPDADGGDGGFIFIGFMVPFCSDMWGCLVE